MREILDKHIGLRFYKASQNERKPEVEKRASTGKDEYRKDLIMRANCRCENERQASIPLVLYYFEMHLNVKKNPPKWLPSGVNDQPHSGWLGFYRHRR
jgi:hypothetical protein